MTSTLSHEQLKAAAESLSRGKHGDSILARINPHEAKKLMAEGGAGKLDRFGIMQFFPEDEEKKDGGTKAVSGASSSDDVAITDAMDKVGGYKAEADTKKASDQVTAANKASGDFNNSILGHMASVLGIKAASSGTDQNGDIYAQLQFEFNPIGLASSLAAGPVAGYAAGKLAEAMGIGNGITIPIAGLNSPDTNRGSFLAPVDSGIKQAETANSDLTNFAHDAQDDLAKQAGRDDKGGGGGGIIGSVLGMFGL